MSVSRKPGTMTSSARFERTLISAAALPLRADAPPVYVAAAPFIEHEVFVGGVLSRRSDAKEEDRRIQS